MPAVLDLRHHPVCPRASPARAAGDEETVRWFELYQDSTGRYRFRLRNGHAALAGSGAFGTRPEAEDAIKALCEGVPSGGICMQPNGVPQS